MSDYDTLWAMEYWAFSSLLVEIMRRPRTENGNNRADPAQYKIKDGVAEIPIRGVLAMKPGYYARLFGWATAYGDIRRMATEASSDSKVRSILLDIDSPGGTVAGAKETAYTLKSAGKVKPLYAWTSNAMSSAAYWLGATACRIGAEETAQVGSIGVIATMMDLSKANERRGIKTNIVTTGKWKAAGHPFKPLSTDEKSYFQERINKVLDIFVRDIARFRGTSEQRARAMSDDARVYLAAGARKNGLIDDVVDSKDIFIDKIKKDIARSTVNFGLNNNGARSRSTKVSARLNNQQNIIGALKNLKPEQIERLKKMASKIIANNKLKAEMDAWQVAVDKLIAEHCRKYNISPDSLPGAKTITGFTEKSATDKPDEKEHVSFLSVIDKLNRDQAQKYGY